MPRLDIILLPLLGGYLFLITFNYTRFYHKRIEKNRLIYNSLLAAFGLIGIVYLTDYFILKNNEFYVSFCTYKSYTINEIRSYISKIIDDIMHISKPGFKQSLFAFIIAYPLAYLLNKIKYFSETFSFDYTITKWGNEYEKLIWNTLGEANDLDKLLMITTKSNKVYIGQVTKLSEPLENTHIIIIPTLSGYREKETQKLLITTDYTDVIENAAEDEKTQLLDNKLGVIIPFTEIVLISRFDFKIFGQFKTSNEDDLND
ncbi:hypothetical protein OBK23_03215 [Empedobacter falsenii]|uniref:hypothetical protein n=1 Tax=Empedobacter falsenii TaxID=343874 RepID=UPI003A7F7959